jgi:hypothetical protein
MPKLLKPSCRICLALGILGLIVAVAAASLLPYCQIMKWSETAWCGLAGASVGIVGFSSFLILSLRPME